MQVLNMLQVGRGLAATAVAAFHLSITMSRPRYGGQAVFADITRYGDRGVDFFFVLSGFIILLAHFDDIGRPEAVRSYLFKRFVRVFPIYWLYTLAFAAAFTVVGGTDARLPATVGDWLTSLSLIRFTAGDPPLPVAWTLFHEVAFYAVFSVLILNLRLGSFSLVAFALVAFANYGYPTLIERNAFAVYTSGYNLFFLLGMMAYLAHRGGHGGYLSLAVGGAIVGIAIAFESVLSALGPLTIAIGFALVLVGVTGLERRGRLRVPPVLVLLGNASYTIYLTHLAFEGLLLKIAIRLDLYQRVGHGVTYLLVLGGTLALGCIVYLIVERPLLSWFRPRKRRIESPRFVQTTGGT